LLFDELDANGRETGGLVASWRRCYWNDSQILDTRQILDLGNIIDNLIFLMRGKASRFLGPTFWFKMMKSEFTGRL
jgi:hypothetical protein